MEKALRKIASHYGYESQSRQAIEEMAELTVAINKHWRKSLNCGRKCLDDSDLQSKEMDALIEEIADVEIMLTQMKMLLICDEEVEMYKEQKIKRQLERIGK